MLKLAEWCIRNNLELNSTKTKEMVFDFRKQSGDHTPLTISTPHKKRVVSFKFLGTYRYIPKDLTWSASTTTLVKKAQQRLHFLQVLRRNHLEEKLLVSFTVPP